MIMEQFELLFVTICYWVMLIYISLRFLIEREIKYIPRNDILYQQKYQQNTREVEEIEETFL